MINSNVKDYCGAETSLSVAKAREILLNAVSPVEGWETVPIRSALGRILIRDVIAPFNVPAHDNSAMDGFAVCAADFPANEARFTLVGTAYAGGAFSGVVSAGQAVRIMTGAMLPRGADSIVILEDAKVEGNIVTLPKVKQIGQHVRRAGEDLSAGKPALLAGKRLGPAELGLIASLGYAEVMVRRRPRIAIFSTGNELASIGSPLASGEIYDSNRYTLYGALTRLGVDILDMGVVRDDPATMERVFAEAAEQADVILTSGGVSVGEADFVKDIMMRKGKIHFWKIDIKPGRPMAFGRMGNAWLFGLPGNPVAVLVNFYQIILDALIKLQGEFPLPPRPSFKVTCTESIRKLTGRREFPRGVMYQEDGQWRVKLSGNQGAGILRSMVEANCFIILNEECGNVAVGDQVDVQPFEGLI